MVKNYKTNSDQLISIEINIEKTIKLRKRAFVAFWIISIMGLILLALELLHFYYCLNNIENFSFNGLGDYLSGTVGLLWSLAGIILIYIAFLGQKEAIHLQQKDLIFQGIELNATHRELKSQTTQLEKQAQAMSQQYELAEKTQYDNNFYTLISLFNDGKRQNSFHISDFTKKDLFTHLRETIMFKYNQTKKDTKDSFDHALKTIGDVFRNHEQQLQPYFYNLAYMLKYVDESKYPEKYKYEKILYLKATLTPSEKVIICYIVNLQDTSQNTNEILKYNLLEALNPEALIHPKLMDKISFKG